MTDHCRADVIGLTLTWKPLGLQGLESATAADHQYHTLIKHNNRVTVTELLKY